MQHLIQIVNELNERGISFHSLQENITMDKSSATGQLMFHLIRDTQETKKMIAATQQKKWWQFWK